MEELVFLSREAPFDCACRDLSKVTCSYMLVWMVSVDTLQFVMQVLASFASSVCLPTN